MRIVLEVEAPMCEHVRGALAPDDVGAPPGIEVRSLCRDGRLIYVVEVPQEPQALLRAKNTVDDVLRSLKAVLGLSGDER